MRKGSAMMAFAVMAMLVSLGCGTSTEDEFKAWLPRFTAACKQSSEAKALIKAASSVDEKRRIKTEQLDKVNANLGNLQKEYRELLGNMSEADRAQAEAQVREILSQYGVS